MRALLALLALTAGCAPRVPETPPVLTGILGGVAIEDDGTEERPLAGRRVEAANLEGTPLAETVTDANGRFSFALPEGRYIVRISFDDGESVGSMEEVRRGGLGPLVQLVRRIQPLPTPFPSTPPPLATPTPAPTPTPYVAIRPNVPKGHGEVRGVVGYHHSSIDFTRLPNRQVVVRANGKTVKTVTTDATGAFVLVLPAGTYEITTSLADAPKNIEPRAPRERIEVPDGRSIESNLIGSDGTR